MIEIHHFAVYGKDSKAPEFKLSKDKRQERKNIENIILGGKILTV